MSWISTVEGGEYVQTTEVVIIVNDNSDDTSSNSNKVMVNVGTSNSDGNNSKDTITELVSNLVDWIFDLVLYSGNGVLLDQLHLSLGISRDKEYKHKIDGINSTHRIEAHVTIVQ